jgi:hypothetical protein
MSPRWRLVLAAAAFLGWLSYLGYSALNKSREPVISRAQAAAAKYAVIARLEDDEGKPRPTITVSENLTPEGPAKGATIEVENLPSANARSGYSGPGEYLLLLTDPPFRVVGQQRSPGNDLANTGPPLVYLWSEGLRRQFQALPKPATP